MASATILSVVTKPASDPTAGAWPDSGSLGYWIKTQSSGPAVGADASLPPVVTSCAWSIPGAVGWRTEAANSLATMALPAALGGGRMVYTWGDIALGGSKILLTTTAPVLVSLCCYSQLVAPPQLSILDAGTSAVLDSVSQPNTAVPPTTWYRIRVDGAVAIRFDSTAWRVCGLTFTPLTASYSDPGLGGVAIGGDWPVSLAIGLDAPGGIEIGVGEGMDPSATRVEQAPGGVEIGGDWPVSLLVAPPTFAGIAIGGEWDGAPPDPDAALPIASEASCLAAIRAALEATGEFDAVWLGPARDPRGRPGDRLLSIAVEPGRVRSQAFGDDGPDGLTIHDATAVLRVCVRADDDELRDAEAMRLTAVARNALNGRKLARGCWPDWTMVSAWSTAPARDVERTVAAALQFRWHEEGWAPADLS